MSQDPAPRVYGDWFDGLMRARAARDKLTGVRRCLKRQRHYAVRSYVWTDQWGSLWTFRLRRDGRVERSWVSTEPRDILEILEPLE